MKLTAEQIQSNWEEFTGNIENILQEIENKHYWISIKSMRKE